MGVDSASVVPGPAAVLPLYSDASEYSDPLSDAVEDGRFSLHPSWFACESSIGIVELAGSFPGLAYLLDNDSVSSCDWLDILRSSPSFSGVEKGLVSYWMRSRLSWWLFWAFENRRVCRTTGSISREERSPLIEDQKQPQRRSRAYEKRKGLNNYFGQKETRWISDSVLVSLREVRLPDLDQM